MKQGYLSQPDFFEGALRDQLLAPLFKQFSVLEMESKFTIRRPRYAGQQLDRVDKFMDYSIASLMAPERATEFKKLLDLSRLLFFVPFEINKKAALNL